MLAAIRSLPAGQNVALFTLGTSLRMIQSFTDSSDILIAAAEKLSAQKSLLYVDHGPDQIREDDSISGADLRKAQEMIVLTKIKDPKEKGPDRRSGDRQSVCRSRRS